MLADIVTGKTSLAEVFFLVALIGAGLAAVLVILRDGVQPIAYALLAGAVAFIAAAFFVL